MPTAQREITGLLKQWSDGDIQALEQLMPLVFDELRQLARSHFRREDEGHTLQPTALVNEVYMRLVDQRRVQWDNRSQFFAFAALLMRRILVDHAKGRRTAKRGGDARKISLDILIGIPAKSDVDLLALDEALTALAKVDPRLARIVELRFFVGLTHEEIGELLDLSVTTIKREWRAAKMWLLREIQGS